MIPNKTLTSVVKDPLLLSFIYTTSLPLITNIISYIHFFTISNSFFSRFYGIVKVVILRQPYRKEFVMKKLFTSLLALLLLYAVTRYGLDDALIRNFRMAKHNARIQLVEEVTIPSDAKRYVSESNLNNCGLALEKEDAYYIVNDNLLLMKTDTSYNVLNDFEVTSAKYGIDEVQIVGDWLFYTANGIKRINLDGTGHATLFKGLVNDLYATSKWIYFINYSDHGSLYRMTINGRDLTRLNENYFSDLLYDENQFYATMRENDTYSMVTLDLEGHITDTLLEDTYASSMIKKNGHIYYRDHETMHIYKVTLETHETSAVVETPISYFALDESSIYYTGRDMMTKFNDAVGLFKFDESTGRTLILDNDTTMSTGSIQVLGDEVLIESDYKKDPFKILRIKKDGSGLAEIQSIDSM